MAVDLPTGLAGNPAFGDGDRVSGVENVLDGQRGGHADRRPGRQRDRRAGVGEDYVDGAEGVDALDGGRAPTWSSAGTGGPTTVSCGPGVDLAIADRGDRVARTAGTACEQVAYGDQRPRAGLVHLQPQRCSTADHVLRLPAMRTWVPLRYAVVLRSGDRRADRPPKLDTAQCAVRLEGRRRGEAGARPPSCPVAGSRSRSRRPGAA